MNPEHLHNMTDAEFIRFHEGTDDPVLREAVRRLEVLSTQLASVEQDITDAEEHNESLRSQLYECDEECQRLQEELEEGQ